MKKIIVLVLTICVCITLVGCNKDLQTQIVNNLSDVRYNIFVGNNELMSVNFMSGYRENPYKYDGISHKKCEFGIITVELKDNNSVANLQFNIKINNVETSGVLEENPYDHTFMSDIGKKVENDSEIYLTIEGLTENMVLTCENLDWALQYDDAIKIGVSELLESANIFVENGKLKAESYLKIIYDQKATENPYYWYFGITGENGTNIAVIFSPITSEIITKSV